MSVAGQAIAVDSQQNVWAVGFSNKQGAGKNDVYVAELNHLSQDLVVETFGGKDDDFGYGIAIDQQDNVWVTGQTCSEDFPLTYNGYNRSTGRCSAFLMELVVLSNTAFTYKFLGIFGGSAIGDSGNAIAIDASGEIVVAGSTYSGLFPVTEGAFQRYPAGSGAQAFVAKFDPSGQQLTTSTLLGGVNDTFGKGVAVNASGEVYLSGVTGSISFPGGRMVPHPNGFGEETAGFLSKLSSDLTALEYTLQVGDESTALTSFEELPTVTPARVHPAGSVYNGTSEQYYAYVDRIDDDEQLSRLRNHWKPDLYINTQAGMPDASPIQPGWWSAQWAFDVQSPVQGDPVSTKAFWIHNRWKPNEYLNVESGSLQSTPIQPGWLSARWTLEQIPGTTLYRIRNVWQPTKCLNIESGTLTASEVGPGWWSSWWNFERVF